MAIDLRNSRDSGKRLSAEEAALLADVNRIQSYLQGHCFTALNFLQRTVMGVGVKLALLGSKGAEHVELGANGWALHPKPVEEVAPAAPTGSLQDRIAMSYKQDYASQRARMAVRVHTVEAQDVYFLPDDDGDADEFLPTLQRFRERTAFQLQEA